MKKLMVMFALLLVLGISGSLAAESPGTRSASMPRFNDPMQVPTSPTGKAGDCANAKVIAALPTEVIEGSTCGHPSFVAQYGGACTIRGVRYLGPDVAYRVELTPGNKNVKFVLESDSVDLVLALVRDCGNGDSCLANSVDFIGPGVDRPEVIEPGSRSYDPGTYYLYVDSFFLEPCGKYNIEVSGINPPRVDFEIKQEESRDPVIAGSGSQNLVYEVRMKNVYAFTATGLLIDLPIARAVLPSGVRLDSMETTDGSVDDERGVWSIAELPPEETAILKVKLTVMSGASSEDSIHNEVSLNRVDQVLRRDIGLIASTETTSILRRSKLILTTEENVDPVVAGSGRGNLGYSVKVLNEGPSDVDDLRLRESLVLPRGVKIQSVTADRGNIGNSRPNGPFEWRVGSLRKGKKAELSISLTVDESADPGRDLIRSRAVVMGLEEQNTGSSVVAERTSVRLGAKLDLKLNGPADGVTAGDGEGNLVYELRVSNGGRISATNLEIRERLPEAVDVTVDSIQPSRGEIIGDTWKLDSLPPGASEKLAVTLTVGPAALPGEDALCGTAVVETVDEPNIGDKRATECTSVERRVALQLLITASDDPVFLGDTLEYVVELTNKGPSDASGLTLQQELSPEVLLPALTPSRGEVSEKGVWVLDGPLIAGGVETLRISLPIDEVAAEAGSIREKVAVRTLKEPNTGTKEKSVLTDVRRGVILKMMLGVSVNPVTAGSEEGLTYTLYVTNEEPVDLEKLRLRQDLTLPPGVVPVAPSDGSSFVWNLDGLEVGETEELETLLDVMPNASDIEAIGIVVRVDELTVPGFEGVGNLGDNRVETSTGIKREVTLSLTGIESADPVVAGSHLVYELTVQNEGPSDASELVLENAVELPDAGGVTVDRRTVTAGEFEDPVWELETLTKGGSESLTVVLTVDSTASPGTDVVKDTLTLTAFHEGQGKKRASVSTSITDVPEGLSCVSPLAGVVAWWPFDDVSDSFAVEIAGRNDGILMGPPAPTNGQVDLALRFDGVDDYVEVADGDVLDLDDFSFVFWLQVEDAMENEGTERTLIDKRSTDPAVGYRILLLEKTLALDLGDGGPSGEAFTRYEGPTLPLGGKWYLVALTVDRDDPLGGSWYLDGNLSVAFDPTGRSGSLASGEPLRIGRPVLDEPPGTGPPFKLDELTLFDRALDEEEVASLYNTGRQCKEIVYLRRDTPICAGKDAGQVDVTVCNHHPSLTQAYDLTFIGLPAGDERCGGDVDGPIGTEADLEVAASRCEAVQVELNRPEGMDADGLEACYQLTTKNRSTGVKYLSQASLWDSRGWCVVPMGPFPAKQVAGEAVTVGFEVTNRGEDDGVLPYELESAKDGGSTLSLAGGEPGSPAFGDVEVQAGEKEEVRFEALDVAPRPLAFHDLRLRDNTSSAGLAATGILIVAPSCTVEPESLCLVRRRFEAQLLGRDPEGEVRTAKAVPLTPDTGYFYFSNPADIDFAVRLIDGREVSHSWWLVYSALTDRALTLTVTDTVTDTVRTYSLGAGELTSGVDVEAFPEEGFVALEPEELLRSYFTIDPDTYENPAPEERILSFASGRFQVETVWEDFGGNTGDGHAVPLGDGSGYFVFSSTGSVDLVVRMVDGRPDNGYWWIFHGALTPVEYTLTVTDMETGGVWQYTNAAGAFSSGSDTEFFPDP